LFNIKFAAFDFATNTAYLIYAFGIFLSKETCFAHSTVSSCFPWESNPQLGIWFSLQATIWLFISFL